MRKISLLIGLAACGSHGMNANGDDTQQPDAPHGGSGSDSSISIDSPASGTNTTIFTILLENHDYAEIVGSGNAPYVNSLIADYGLATNYKDTGHPSTPNYLNLISGANQYPGVFDVNPQTPFLFPSAAASLGGQLQTANLKWRSYQESEATPCMLTDDGSYAPRHDPFLYFTEIQSAPNNLCADVSVDYTNFPTDLATNTYRYMWITPNLTDDGHDPSTDPVGALKTTDTWLKNNVPAILASGGFTSGGVLFITWDEAEGRNGDNADQVPMIIISPRIKTAGMQSATAYTHSSYLATVEDLLALPRLATVTATPNMMEFLNP